MIFENDQPIDDNLLDLVRRFKELVGENPDMKWVKERSTWVLTTDKWVSEPISISYHWIDKNKFEVFTVGHVFGSFQTAKEALGAFVLLRFMEQGIPNEVIQFLAQKMKNPHVTMREAIDKIPYDSSFELTMSQMEILGIDPRKRGKVIGRKFGL